MRDATARLDKVSDTPRLDAELLLADACGITRNRLLLDPPKDVPREFEELVRRREAGEPVAYILGRRDFWTIELEVGPGVLIPRPDSEALVEGALDHFETSPPRRILDLGTGPGSLLLAALDQWPEATGLGVDASEVALDYARRNATRLGMADRAAFRLGDWGEDIDERFDLVLCNPPYVAANSPDLGTGVAEYEPHEALFAGEDGLEEYRDLAPQLARLVRPEGLVALEIGHDQAETVLAIMRKAGLSSMLRRDLAGRPRALLLVPEA
nr:peptide chain release factor N(5)-glutamine methyltransferase [Sphingomicrobium sp. B8]